MPASLIRSRTIPTANEWASFPWIYNTIKFRPAEGNYSDKTTGSAMDFPIMRVEEMYLIEAEALSRSGKGTEAFSVMKAFMDNRDSDWAASHSSITPEDVFLQKRIELWAEGHIFYDYLRFKKSVDRDYTGSNHLEKKKVPAGSWKFIYQLPQGEIDNNVELSESDQNPLE
jgi:hypothetical protein